MIETRHSVRCSRANGLGEVSLSLLLPVVVAGLIFGAACGAPDEVLRHASPAQTGGDSSSSSTAGTGGVAGSTAQPAGGSASQGGAGDSGGTVGTGGKSSAGGTVRSGGTIATGGKSGTGGISATGGKTGTGGISATGGKSGTGGTSATGGASGTGGISATGGAGSGGADGGVGGASGDGGINPFRNGGSTNGGAGGTRSGGVSAGGNGGGGVATGGSSGGGSGGTSGSGGATSTVATGALQVWVVGISGSTGQVTFNVRIDNMTSQSTDMSTVTLRYWYKDEGLGTALKVSPYYVSIGHSNTGSVVFNKVVAVTAAGADHYFELSFGGTLTAKNDSSGNDKFNVDIGLLNGGAFDPNNDYSYNAGATGYDSKITLYAGGKLIWGTEP